MVSKSITKKTQEDGPDGSEGYSTYTKSPRQKKNGNKQQPSEKKTLKRKVEAASFGYVDMIIEVIQHRRRSHNTDLAPQKHVKFTDLF